MQIEIRNDSVIIDGYVNAVGRDSRPVMPKSAMFPDKCVEQVVPGAFGKSLDKRPDVDMLLNHNKNRKLGSTGGGELTLREDSIGLRAHAVVTDPEVITKARNGELAGWSFGMYVNGEEKEERAGDIPRRKLTDIDVFEVSLIDRTMQPCYAGTSVECRADGDTVSETRTFEDTAEVVDNTSPPDLSEYEKRLADLRAMSAITDAEKRLAKLRNAVPPSEKAGEFRHNENHDPKTGEFTSGSGGNASSGVDKSGESSIIVSKKQFGRKVGKHAQDYGLDANNAEHREQMRKIINDIHDSPDIIKTGNWSGQKEPVNFYIKGNDVVVCKKNDEFITILKGGVNNDRIKNAGKR